MARRMNAQIVESDADHTPGVTAPDLVTEVISQALESVPAH